MCSRRIILVINVDIQEVGLCKRIALKTSNTLVEDFAKDHGLTSHHLSVSKRYFQPGSVLLGSGLVELTSNTALFQRNVKCAFRAVDIDEIDSLKHLYEA